MITFQIPRVLELLELVFGFWSQAIQKKLLEEQVCSMLQVSGSQLLLRDARP